MSLIPGKVGRYLRLAFYRVTLKRCGREVVFSFGTTINHRTVEVGSYVNFGRYCSIGTTTIDDHVLVGSRVSIISGGKQHETSDLSNNITEGEPVFERVHIGSNTWIGEGSLVLADVGGRCVIAVGSVVFRPVPDGKMAMGNPARVISRKFSTDSQSKSLT